MFSSTASAVHVERLRDELAQVQAEARRLHSEFHQIERETPDPFATTSSAPPPRHTQEAYCRSLIDRGRGEDVVDLLRRNPGLEDVALYTGMKVREYAAFREKLEVVAALDAMR